MPDELVPPDATGGAGDSPAFSCSRTDGGLDAAWVHTAGELDIATAPQLERTLRETQLQARLVVLDLRELAFMDCYGMHAIVSAGARARLAGRRLVLLRAPRNIDRLFTLTGSFEDVEIGDIAPVVLPVHTGQRSLVSSSLLRTGEGRPRRPAH